MLKKIIATFLAAAVLAGTIATSAAAQGLDGKVSWISPLTAPMPT